VTDPTAASGAAMRVTVVGCSGSMPGPESAASCYLVEAAGFRLLLDLGSGALGPLQRYCRPAEVEAVLVSHLHPDHCIDLLPLYVARTYDPAGECPPIPVLAPEGAGEHLARAYGRADPPGLTGRFDFRAWNGRHEVGPFTVSVARVAHPVPTYAMRLEVGGRALVYSGDTGPTDMLVDIARDADLALFESAFEEGRDDRLPADLHLTGRQAGEHAARAGVRRLVVTHLPPWNDPATSLAAATAAFGGPVELARPGATYDV
jgi:ribonuclease BN (tRNA processing enzyme)